MSAVFTFKGKDFVAMAGDRREKNIINNTFRDDCRKIFKRNNFIYGTTGSGFLIDLFEENNTVNNIKEFENYADDFFKKLNQTKDDHNAKVNWCKQKFIFTLQVAFIEEQHPNVAQYFISWCEDEHISVILPKEMTTKDVPLMSLPKLGKQNNIIEDYIKNNHPNSIIEAQELSRSLFGFLSKSSDLVSETFDFESIKIRD